MSADVHPYLAGAACPRVLAHRGFVPAALAAQGIVENSHSAIAAAVEAGAEYVETDCHLTADGAVVLAHDADLARVFGDPRAVAETSRAELAALMADRGGLLTLAEALEAHPRTRFNLDVKAAAAAEPAGRIVAPHAERVLVTSFAENYRLAALAAAMREIAIRDRGAGGSGGVDGRVSGSASRVSRPATSPGRAALTRILLAAAMRSRRRLDRVLDGFDALQIPERHRGVPVLTRRLLSEAHRRGVEVHVWTVNDPQRMAELVELGVDGVITDRADLGLATLGN